MEKAKTSTASTTPKTIVEKPETKVVTKTKTVYKDHPVHAFSGYSSNSSSSGNSGNNGSYSSNEPAVSQKKGMSKAAKGTIIGTVGGAAAGAIISKKNPGAGAVIGGIVGGATGYGLGCSKDKKDGRVP